MSAKLSPEDMTRIFNWGVAVDDAIQRIQSGVIHVPGEEGKGGA